MHHHDVVAIGQRLAVPRGPAVHRGCAGALAPVVVLLRTHVAAEREAGHEQPAGAQNADQLGHDVGLGAGRQVDDDVAGRGHDVKAVGDQAAKIHQVAVDEVQVVLPG